MASGTGDKIPDGDGGWIWVSEIAGPKGRKRLRISRRSEGTAQDPRFGRKAALELQKRLSDFIYRGTREGPDSR
jgi:hypothetical protein